MIISPEGHLQISPADFQAKLGGSLRRLASEVLLEGTPIAFPSKASHCEYLEFVAIHLGIHPRNVAVRGSSKIGFSITPDPAKVWMEFNPDSDLDLAIIDPDYYHFIDREVRKWERRAEDEGTFFRGREREKYLARRNSRAHYCYRYFDLPDISCVREHNTALKESPVEEYCGQARIVTGIIT